MTIGNYPELCAAPYITKRFPTIFCPPVCRKSGVETGDPESSPIPGPSFGGDLECLLFFPGTREARTQLVYPVSITCIERNRAGARHTISLT